MAPPKMPWFRFYVEDISSRWMRRLAPAERWLYGAINGAARESPVPGVLLVTETEPMTVEDLADFAGMKERDVTVGLEKMERLDVVYRRSDGAWVVANWDARQPMSDDVTARTRKHRSKGRPPDDDPPSMERSIDVPGNRDRAFEGTGPERSRERVEPVRGNGNGTPPELEQRTLKTTSSVKENPKARARATGDGRRSRSEPQATSAITLDSTDGSPDDRAIWAIDWLAWQRTDDAPNVRDRTRYQAKIVDEIRMEHWPRAIANARLGWTPRDIAARIENSAHRPRPRAVEGGAA